LKWWHATFEHFGLSPCHDSYLSSLICQSGGGGGAGVLFLQVSIAMGNLWERESMSCQR
jgi:hypothetical protein